MLREVEISALLFFLLVVTTILTALIALRIIIGVPLKHLLDSIHSAGKEKTTVRWAAHDELGEVITAYNDMIVQVDQRAHDLEKARELAEDANRAKSAFLANMSHELRNPLNAIIGFSRIVMRRSRQELATRQYDNMTKILTSAEHLLSLINNILDLSKIEAGRMEVRQESCDIELLIDTCLHTMEPMLKSKGLRLQTRIESDLPVIYSDQEKLRQILLNLLSNALKFTKQGGIVTVSAKITSGQAVIAVTDTGIGIAETKLASIFDEFTQLDSGSTKEYGGTGLGLAICRHLTELLGGCIAVHSQLHQGSTFTVTLPVQHNISLSNMKDRYLA
jgi:signal transduction histidine kinase